MKWPSLPSPRLHGAVDRGQGEVVTLYELRWMGYHNPHFRVRVQPES